MSIKVEVPVFAESVTEGTLLAWHKKVGETVTRGDFLAEIETDKVTLDVPAPQSGVITELIKNEGDIVLSSEVIAHLDEAASAQPADQKASEKDTAFPQNDAEVHSIEKTVINPAAKKIAIEQSIDNLSEIQGTGRGNRITKSDMLKHIEAGKQNTQSTSTSVTPSVSIGPRTERRVKMTRLRATIAKRLLQAQQQAAILTTYNEVNMSAVMNLRKRYGERFQEVHAVRLGFMSFFTKIACQALKEYPAVNAFIDGDEVVYHNYQDIGVAMSTERGLVVPVLRQAGDMGLAEIEKQIVEFGNKAKNGQLSIDDMTGGTFSISNGGIFGSLLSTPILNPPQTAILGMHSIQQRPVAVDGEVVIQPMMYLALSYDHRMIDGKEAVQFLAKIKSLLEDPVGLLLAI